MDDDRPMKFTIRDLFLVTMIVALAVGWGVEHRGRILTEKDHQRLRSHAKKLSDEFRFAKTEYEEVRVDLNAELARRGITETMRTGDQRFYRDVNWELADEPLPP
jgi:hypothetical protein